MIFTFNYGDRKNELEIEDTKTKIHNFELSSFEDVVFIASMALATVYPEFIIEAIDECVNELGCVYKNVYELIDDIYKYYI